MMNTCTFNSMMEKKKVPEGLQMQQMSKQCHHSQQRTLKSIMNTESHCWRSFEQCEAANSGNKADSRCVCMWIITQS